MILWTPTSTPTVVRALCEQTLRVGDARPHLVCGLMHRLVALLRLTIQLVHNCNTTRDNDGDHDGDERYGVWHASQLRRVQCDVSLLDATALALLGSPLPDTRRLALRLMRTNRSLNEAIVARCAHARRRSPGTLYLADVVDQSQQTVIRDAARLTGHASLLSQLVDIPSRRHLWVLAALTSSPAQACWAHRFVKFSS